ncbi:AAA family ATPase [Arachidicoccus sp.]|uniref:AAA family ATPase n=1 Tax=Arachidicoccus sp. TaxID=1872624 RepID=UPI003D199716
MLPGKGSLKADHKTSKLNGISVLKTAVLFGANASGKSNLIKAIDFGKKLVLRGNKPEKPIDYPKFRLDKQSSTNDSRIEYEIQHKGKNYAYGFTFNNELIKEEWLYEIGAKKEVKIFERNFSNKEIFNLDYIIQKLKKEEERQFLRFIAKGTPNNQLFLTEIRTRKVKENVSKIEDFLNVIDWFQNSLKVILPDDKYNEGLKFELKQDVELLTTFEEFLSYFDTGIDGVCLEKVDVENIDIPKPLLVKIGEDLLSEKSESIRASIISKGNTTYFLSVKNGDIVIEKFMTKHKVKNATSPEKFDTNDESDGTNRIMDFIPLLMDLLKGDNVFIIDEMERSLHPNLIYDLLDLFLSKSTGINSQLVLATHESSLLTQKLLRKDEIWFVVKDNFGASRLHSLEQYNVRFDKEIRKDYLLGRFKAIPRIGNRNKLTAINK